MAGLLKTSKSIARDTTHYSGSRSSTVCGLYCSLRQSQSLRGLRGRPAGYATTSRTHYTILLRSGTDATYRRHLDTSSHPMSQSHIRHGAVTLLTAVTRGGGANSTTTSICNLMLLLLCHAVRLSRQLSETPRLTSWQKAVYSKG